MTQDLLKFEFVIGKKRNEPRNMIQIIFNWNDLIGHRKHRDTRTELLKENNRRPCT